MSWEKMEVYFDATAVYILAGFSASLLGGRSVLDILASKLARQGLYKDHMPSKNIKLI